MAVLMTFEAPDTTPEQYARVNEILGISGDDTAPEGLIQHTACNTGSGILIVDVWESEAALGRFFDERLGAALAEAGVAAGPPRIEPVLNRITGRG